MNAMSEINMEGVVERFEGLGALEEGWQALSKADLRNEEQTRKSVARVSRAFAVSVFVLLLLNSAGLVQLVQGLSVGPVQDTVIAMSEAWHGEMERQGVADVLQRIRGEVATLVDAPWDDMRNELGADLRGHLGLDDLDQNEQDRTSILRGAVLDPSSGNMTDS